MHTNDQTGSLSDLKKHIQKVIDDREWGQFHSPKDIAMNLSIEANELLEKFLWITTEQSFDVYNKNPIEVQDEIADVFLTVLLFCNMHNIDLTTAFLNKVEKIKKNYPIEKSKGNNLKYDKL